MLAAVRRFVEKHELIKYGDRIVVGLSGGADSVCLFRILVSLREELGLTIYAVHVNHGIRGKDAKRDEIFACGLADKYGVECRVVTADIPKLAIKWKMTEEEAGRKVRYDTFEDERRIRNADSIAVGHHANDKAETVLFRMCRGTGIKGMAGIMPSRGNIIRPLLDVKKADIYGYLSSIGQDYVEDTTNFDTVYDRNRIRELVIPEMEKVNTEAVMHICGIADKLAEISDWLEEECDKIYHKYVKNENGAFVIGADRIKELNKIAATHLIRKIIGSLSGSMKDIEERHIESCLKLADMESGKIISLPYGIAVRMEYGRVIFEKEADMLITPKEFEYVISDGKDMFESKDISDGKDMSDSKDITDGKDMFESNDITDGKDMSDGMTYEIEDVYLPDEKKYVKKLNLGISFVKKMAESNCIKHINYDIMKNSLSIRRPRENDYYVYDGKNRKKISRYMIDNKIPRKYRECLVVVAEGSHVYLIIGGRMAKDCYVTDETEKILKVKWGEQPL